MNLQSTLLQEFDSEMANTRKTLERVPEKFDWAPHPKSMTMGRLAQHLAEIPIWGENTITLDELDLAPMVPDNTALHGTAFTVSIDLIGHGVTTGISAHDRARTIQAAVDASSSPEDFARPGHVFPLRARPGGVLERRGQTEDFPAVFGRLPRLQRTQHLRSEGLVNLVIIEVLQRQARILQH